MKFIAFSDKGMRKLNEDAYFISEKVCIVADGVGGNAYGEVASKICIETIGNFFQKNELKNITIATIENAVNLVIAKLTATATQYPETKEMKTTMAMIAFGVENIAIAWMGDSRVYFGNHSTIVYQTTDHSLANELREKGEQNEAYLQTIRNYITKAIGVDSTDKPTVLLIDKNDIKKGDWFFICSDGVLENLTEEKLLQMMLGSEDIDKKINSIAAECLGKTKDNFTFILIETT